ncbi:MAG: tetratricopeptide repeat protein, partial [bacterium]|nr:tetratricopeptide repeat protein [bacterium]
MTRLSALLALSLLLACSSGDTEPGAAEADPGKQRIRSFWTTFRQANQQRLEGDLTAAAAGFRAALELDTQHEESLFHLGGVLEQTGDYAAAIDAYQRLIEINPASGRGLTQLAELLSSVAPGIPTDYDRAQNLLDRAIKLNPEQAGPFLQLGRLGLNRG